MQKKKKKKKQLFLSRGVSLLFSYVKPCFLNSVGVISPQVALLLFTAKTWYY